MRLPPIPPAIIIEDSPPPEPISANIFASLEMPPSQEIELSDSQESPDEVTSLLADLSEGERRLVFLDPNKVPMSDTTECPSQIPGEKMDETVETNEWYFKNQGALEKAQEEGINPGTPLYTKFNRLLAADNLEMCSKDQYRDMSIKQKSEFRKLWAKMAAKKGTIRCDKSKTYQKMDQNLGEMMTFPELVVSFGGTDSTSPLFPQCVTAATNYKDTCLKLQGEWIARDALAGAETYFRVKKQHMSVFQRARQIYQSNLNDVENADTDAEISSSANTSDLPPPTAPPRSANNKDQGTKPKAKATTQTQARSKATSVTPSKKKPCASCKRR